MNASKPIDISKSSLISLKAELSRKQDEVSFVKANKSSSYVCPTINPNKKPLPAITKSTKKIEKNIEDEGNTVIEENSKALEHSRNVLEIKSKLYNELQEGRLVTETGRGAEYLVDFAGKLSEKRPDVDASCPTETDGDEPPLSDDERPSDPEDDWVDYTDVVGRSRRCLRRDLSAMRARDEESLLPPEPPSPPPADDSAAQRPPAAVVPPAPPHVEAMRRQWLQQEQKLLNKNNVHYEDLLFNEARTHGVGYYAFSTNEEERSRQLQELEQRRQETLRHQKDASGLRARRDMQLKARLQAAKARNRQRLGLPAEQPAPDDQPGDVVEVENADESKSEEHSKAIELEAALKRAAHIRPWDAEKLGVKTLGEQPTLMSQGEWVEKNREERIPEFAPPEMYKETGKTVLMRAESPDYSDIPLPSQRPSLFFTSKKPKSSGSVFQGKASEQRQSRLESACAESDEEAKSPPKRKRAEIPPPPTAEYYAGNLTGGHRKQKHKVQSDVGQSISEGLNYLTKQKKMKDCKRDKGLLDII